MSFCLLNAFGDMDPPKEPIQALAKMDLYQDDHQSATCNHKENQC